MDLRGALFVVIISTMARLGCTLQCLQCENIEIDNDVLSIGEKSNPGCKSATSTVTVECLSDGAYACSYFEGEATVHAPVLGSTTVKVQARGCSLDLGSNGCTSGDQAGLSYVKEFLKFENVDMNGMYCQCDTDFCIAGCSGLYVADTCLAWWIIGVSGGGALLLLILLCTCCCCCCGCCGCCKKDRPQVTVVQAHGAPATYVRLQSPIGDSSTSQQPLTGKTTIVGIENPYRD